MVRRRRAASAADNVLARIQSWARTTRIGDLSEVRGLSDSHAVWPRVTSTRENCLGKGCPEISRCHVAVARRQALDSDIVIVNHHLLLADLALKEDGFGDILGSSDAVILDEAHQIPDLATQFFGANVSSRRVEGVLKEIHAAMGHAPELVRNELGDRAHPGKRLHGVSVRLSPQPTCGLDGTAFATQHCGSRSCFKRC